MYSQWRGEIKIKKGTKEVLERVYSALIEMIAELYAQAEIAVAEDNYNDASLLFSQADRLYQVAENLEALIAEQEENNEQWR